MFTVKGLFVSKLAETKSGLDAPRKGLCSLCPLKCTLRLLRILQLQYLYGNICALSEAIAMNAFRQFCNRGQRYCKVSSGAPNTVCTRDI